MKRNQPGSITVVLGWVWPLLILAAGLIVTVLVWRQQADAQSAELQLYFEHRTRDALARVEARLSHYEQVLLDTRALFQTAGPVTAEAFASLVSASEVQKRFPGIQGIGYAEVILPGNPLNGSGLRTSIRYLEPLNFRNQRAIGFDMASESIRRQAMIHAALSGASALSGKVRLVQETDVDVQAGFLLYVPVYRNVEALASPEALWRNLRGWVYAPFRMNDFLEGVLGEAGSDLDLEVFDGLNVVPEARMYDRVPGVVVGSVNSLKVTTKLTFAGHTWSLVVSALPGLVERRGNDLSPLVLWLGAVISALFSLLGFLVVRQVDQVRRLNVTLSAEVDERTRALNQEQERLTSILRGTNVGTWEWNVQTGQAIFNKRWAEIVGYTLEELQPISIKTWEALGHPDDLAESEPLLEQHFRGELEYYAFECRMRHKDGHWVWVLDRGAVATRTGDGRAEWMFGTHTDITERKASEAALKSSEKKFVALFTILPVGVVLTSDTGQIIEANQAAREILGLTPSETLSRTYDSPSWSVLRPDGSPMPADEYASVRAMRENRTISDIEMGVQRPDGQVRWLLTSSSPLPVSGLGVCIVFIDVTERKQAEAARVALESQNQQLKKGQSLAQMAGSVAHLFNNKLQAVMSGLELVKALGPGDKTTEALARAEASVLAATEVSRLLLAYLGQSSLDREQGVLTTILQSGLPAFQRTLPPSVSLKVSLEAPGPRVLVNAEQLRQVLSQLLSNALESLGRNGGVIELASRVCASTEISEEHRFPLGWVPDVAEYALIEVRDTGSGIPTADFEKLFDPFFTTKFTGRGLGLAVILGIVKAHGGGITVESRSGEGSTFRVFLPTVVATELASEPSVSVATKGTGSTVLLVDDEPTLLDSVAELIELLGFSVLTAGDGLEALEVYRAHRSEIGCVLTDLTMPRLDGWGLLKALRELDPEARVILASGYDKAQVLSGDHPEVPTDYVSKPFDLGQLQRVLGVG